MATLFLANLRPQIFSFTFQVPGQGKGATWRLNLDPYTQKMVYRDTNVDLLKTLLDQVHHYGFREYDEALANDKFDGYAFSFGKPFSDDEMFALKAHHFHCSQASGQKRRRQSLSETGSKLLNNAVSFNVGGLEDLGKDPKNFGLRILQEGSGYGNGVLDENYGLR